MEHPQGLTPERKKELSNDLAELDEFIEQFSERAKALTLRGPQQMIGVLNVLAMIYRRTVDEGFDVTVENAPLIALPNHLRMMEERMDNVLKTIATTHIRTIQESP